MGCKPSKLNSNLRPVNPDQVIGSTVLQADQICVLGSSIFLPITENGDSAIIEIEINDKKMRVYRGYKNTLSRIGLSD
jgi:hypothetical protein